MTTTITTTTAIASANSSDALRDLVAEAVSVTAAEPPALLESDAPTLKSETSDLQSEIYLVGVIGGKDVGKSSLVNALAGADIATVTGSGPGTESALAYAHESRAAEVLALLRRDVDPAAEVVPHRLPHLVNQVLLDLPDIDSLHERHIAVTRRALRHLLFPIWAQSLEKYGDLAPRQLLKAVAEGNDPANFTFVLTKCDQAGASPEALEAVREDYAGRLAQTLALAGPADVYLTSARAPDGFDLPRLRDKLSRERARPDVRQALDLARTRRQSSLLQWFDTLDLPARVDRLKRIEADAAELLADRIGRPVLDRAVAGMLDDPAPRAAAVEDALSRRLAHWPLVGLVHTAVAPLSLLARRVASPAPNTAALVDLHLRPADLSTTVQTTFALVQQAHPTLAGNLPRKFWEPAAADAAVDDLRLRLGSAIDQRQQAAIAKASSAPVILAPLRVLLTLGVLLWFPLLQPLLASYLGNEHWLRDLSLTFVRIFSVEHLLANVAFLVTWFVILYVALRRHTARKVARTMTRWDAHATPAASPAGQAAAWLADLAAPFAESRRRLEALIDRADAHRRP